MIDCRKAGTENGFSLLEVMVVVVVIGIALASGFPYLRGYVMTQDLEGSVDTFVSQLDRARHRAVSESHPYRILLNSPAVSQYQLHSDENGNDAVDGGETVLGPFILPTKISLQTVAIGGGTTLVYEPNGMLRPGQGGTVVFADQDGRTRTLVVYASGIASRQ